MVRLLDCTLRDGSYAINFQFTARDTARLVAALDSAGIELIEVGHGVGLGASQKGHGDAAETDEAYLAAAASAVRRAQFGMFCIPGVAQLAGVDLAAEYKMGFLRVGSDIEAVEKSAPFIARAREHGMFVCANLMKSYCCPPREFAARARLSKSYGAEVIYIVDSAGGMLPAEVRDYIRAVQDVCDMPAAFHGHDNLGLAVHNSIHAMECGAEIIDVSLQGLGRSSGNAPTELVVAVLARMGIDLGLDPLAIMDIGEELVRPLVQRRGLSSIDITSGLAQFHSSYMKVIRQVSSRFEVDPRSLIIEVCKFDRANAPLALVEQCAARIKRRSDVLTARFHFEQYHGEEQTERRGAAAAESPVETPRWKAA
jgi:4-hydroxy 2-oxovalerate aldolase